MSVVKEVFIICDGCGSMHGVDMRQLSSTQQLKSAKESGWIRRFGKDFCNLCRAPKTVIYFTSDESGTYKHTETSGIINHSGKHAFLESILKCKK